MNAVDSSSTKIVAMLLCGGMSNSPRGEGCDLWCGVVWCGGSLEGGLVWKRWNRLGPL